MPTAEAVRRGRGGVLFSVLAVVGFVAVLAYLPAVSGEFVYDDHRLIRENEGLRRPLDLRRAFLRDYYASDVDRMGLGYYRPVAVLSNELDFRLGGGRPVQFHLTNLVLHACCSVLVVLLAAVLFGGQLAAPVLAGLLFALHPAHAESVAFISGRVDPLAVLFSLLATLFHLRANRTASGTALAWRAAAGAAWLPALLSKEVAVVVPFLILLVEIAQEGPPARGTLIARLRRYVPYAVVLLPYLALRWSALGRLVGPATGDAPFSLLRIPVVLGSYLAWVVLPPAGLHLEPEPVAGALAFAAGGVAIAALALAAWLWRRGSRLESALLAWCIVSLLPVAQVRPIETALSERFLYLPTVGSCLFLAGLVAGAKTSGTRRVIVGAGLVLATVYLAILVPRVLTWRDEARLWAARAEEEPGSLKTQLNLARALARQGDAPGARRAYDRAAEIAPEMAAMAQAERVSLLGISPGEDAVPILRQALELNPRDGALWGNLGFLLLERGDAESARDAFERAIGATPLRSTAWLGLGLASLTTGDIERAEIAAGRALELNPAHGLARVVLAECALKRGRPCDALKMAAEARLEAPDEAAAMLRIAGLARAGCKDRP